MRNNCDTVSIMEIRQRDDELFDVIYEAHAFAPLLSESSIAINALSLSPRSITKLSPTDDQVETMDQLSINIHHHYNDQQKSSEAEKPVSPEEGPDPIPNVANREQLTLLGRALRFYASTTDDVLEIYQRQNASPLNYSLRREAGRIAERMCQRIITLGIDLPSLKKSQESAHPGHYL